MRVRFAQLALLQRFIDIWPPVDFLLIRHFGWHRCICRPSFGTCRRPSGLLAVTPRYVRVRLPYCLSSA